MKTIQQFIGYLGGYEPKSEGERNFVQKHIVDKYADSNGNGDDIFKATNVKVCERPGERHGYEKRDDESVYESIEIPSVTPIIQDIEKREDDDTEDTIDKDGDGDGVSWLDLMKKYGISDGD